MQVSSDFSELLGTADSITETVSRAKSYIAVAVNSAMVETYWNIGRHIVEIDNAMFPKRVGAAARTAPDGAKRAA